MIESDNKYNDRTNFLEEIAKATESLSEDKLQIILQFIRFLRQQSSIANRQPKKKLSLENQPFIGMWQDRPEMKDSVDWVRAIRKQEWQR